MFVDRVVVVGPEGKKIEKRTTRPRTDCTGTPAAAGEEATDLMITRPANSSPPAWPSSWRTAST